MATSSRLIVKNIPKHITEEKLAAHFSSEGGEVTDAKIIFRNGKSRRFAYVGFKSEKAAIKARDHFNSSYIDTSKVDVDFARS